MLPQWAAMVMMAAAPGWTFREKVLSTEYTKRPVSQEAGRFAWASSIETTAVRPTSRCSVSRTARFNGRTKDPEDLSGNREVLHLVAPISTLTLTEPNPPAWGTRSSISSAMSVGSVTNTHGAASLCHSHNSAEKVNSLVRSLQRDASAGLGGSTLEPARMARPPASRT